jgi:hypothetical protein
VTFGGSQGACKFSVLQSWKSAKKIRRNPRMWEKLTTHSLKARGLSLLPKVNGHEGKKAHALEMQVDAMM